MNWDRILGNWKQLKGIIGQRWGRLTADYAGVVAASANTGSARCRPRMPSPRRQKQRQTRSGLPNGWPRHKADPIHK